LPKIIYAKPLLQRLSNNPISVPQSQKTVATRSQQTAAFYRFKQRLCINVAETQKTVASRKGHGRIERANKTVALGYRYGFFSLRNGF
jgi:hypothetical protein